MLILTYAGFVRFVQFIAYTFKILLTKFMLSQQIVHSMEPAGEFSFILCLKVGQLYCINLLLSMVHKCYWQFIILVNQDNNIRFHMLVKPQATTDNFDISWIQKQAECWVYFPLQQVGPIYAKAVVKGIVPLSFNKGNSKVMCLLENGQQCESKASNLEKRRPSNSIERDLISLEVINPAEILYQIKRRFQDKKIHTYMWNSLIIVNPFIKIEGMYDQKVMRSYSDKVIHGKKGLSQIQPHIYGFICNIMNNMKVSDKAQMISISGESGSGKTQTNKQCLKIISYVCESHLKTSEQIPTSLIQQRILNCDSVLQCFGNAKTSKNDNSSRFGKLITQRINSKDMEILHCEVKVFFLEKSRIIHQILGERNFHIFYLLLTYCPEPLKAGFGLKTKGGLQMRISDFNYIVKDFIPNSNIRQEDKLMWNNLNMAFKLLDISEAQKKHIFQIIIAVLHLGNLQFDDTHLTDHEPCQIANQQLLPILSSLLMMEQKTLKEGLVFNKKEIAGELMYLPMAEKQCVQGRDSIAKALYENLFLWIVEQLNKKVNQNHKPQKHSKIIKMLDIYGFQVFQHNSFEQLCVNYTNQRIHQIYLDQVFKHEKNLLKKQGLQSAIPQLKFTDNTKIIQVLDTSFKSVYNLLDESCNFNVKDDDFLASVKKSCEGHQHFPPSNNVTLKKCFIIRHTPGDIQYMAIGFRNKNKDFLRQDILQKFSQSKSPIVGEKFNQLRQQSKSEVNKKFLGFKIRKQVTALMNQMSFNSDMHFIRCIKPNQQKKPLTFVERVCYNQIRYLGVLDTVRMRKDCYHVRVPYKDFYKKYGILRGDVREMIRVQQGQYSQSQCKQMTKSFLEQKFKNAGLDYLFGTDKLFMKMQTNNYLETVLKQRTKKISYGSTIIKAIYRLKHNECQRKNFLVHVRKVQKTMKHFLRDIITIKRKNAVRIIQRQWIKRSETYFKRKRRIPLMVIQKHLKKIIQKKNYQQKHNSIQYAKNMISSIAATHEAVSKFEKFVFMKKQFNQKIFQMIWNKMNENYKDTISIYFKYQLNFSRNRNKIQSAQEKTYNRLIVRNKQTLNKYFKSIHWAKRFENLHRNIVMVQKCIRMAMPRLQFTNLKKKVLIIQRAWRKYKQLKEFNQAFTFKHYKQVASKEQQWSNLLYRNIKYKGSAQPVFQGSQKALQKFQKIKKDKVILFYYLIDFEILCQNPSTENWLKNYLALNEDALMKLNPIQYLDVSNTHTAAATTNKLYTWGDIDKIPGIQQYQVVQGRLSKISTEDNATILDAVNPTSRQILGNNINQAENEGNKQWSTLNLNFVLLNGIVLTMQGVSFAKLNTPEKVNQLSCGMAHVICKTILKKVFTWGRNDSGQLGTGDYFETNSMNPRLVEYFYKRRLPVCQISASPNGSIVMDTNNKIYWFGTNGTIKNVCLPEQCLLSSKSAFLSNTSKYSPIRIISKWCKTMSVVGVTIACHDGLLKNQISLRKKVLQNLMIRWNQDIQTINPPYSQSVADHISQRHMPLPTINAGSTTPRTMTNKEIKQKIISDIHKIEEAERELLRTRRNR